MNNIFVWGDPHLGHRSIALHCDRSPWIRPNPNYNKSEPYNFKLNNPKDVDMIAHDEGLVQNHNSLVKKGDMVYILGDFAWSNHSRYLSRLNGKQIIILGNHDKMNQKSLANFTEVHEMGCRKRICGQDITFCHYAMRSWASSCHGSWHIYAHSHHRLPEFNNMMAFDGGVDGWGYGVLPWDVIVAKMQLKKDWIRENNSTFVDGETKADGEYDKSFEQRIIESRKRNKSLMKKMNYVINEEMWPMT